LFTHIQLELIILFDMISLFFIFSHKIDNLIYTM